MWNTELMISQAGAGTQTENNGEDFVIILSVEFSTFCVARKHFKTMDPQCLPLNGTALITVRSEYKEVGLAAHC